MSEPLSSLEIEDVLSSIRRLVSEDMRPAARAAAASAPVPVDPLPDAGKLLLTPALRVVEQPAVAIPAATGADVSAVARPAVETYDDAGLDDSDSGLKALLDTVAPQGAVDPADTWDALADGDADVAAWAASSAPPVQDPPPVMILADQGDDLFWAAPGLPEAEMPDDSVESVAKAPSDEVIGHWSAEAVPAVDWAEDEAEWAAEEPVHFVAYPRKSVLADDWHEPAEAEPRVSTGPRIVRPPQPQPDPEPDTGKPQAAQPDKDPGLFDGDTMAFDEEMLRDIVRDIIREELAGALGERITRNVRKLVRVEINRALSAREFD